MCIPDRYQAWGNAVGVPRSEVKNVMLVFNYSTEEQRSRMNIYFMLRLLTVHSVYREHTDVIKNLP